MGAKTPEQLSDNIAASELVLTAEDLAVLDEVSALKPEYPGWMNIPAGWWLARTPAACRTRGNGPESPMSARLN